ncbi:molybdenum cofactor guanylyltransferase MobA [Rahnella woolbedingensis]|uniref:Molybdenum cofactor guanylyltransferase n=1 Tax=Rahnella woolbedingensis TaxID=1510574 RepID=A0A419N8I2_9GAMM|nr:molybdenum cofactor guanylyltransferase MobA [Rahnella woolbedingensis]RJT43742.1 molybdenum cofactor guanylyltransferase MobA [Rahnella woolbedingensis]
MDRNSITGVILAGGRSSRMGEDKGLVEINGRPLFELIAERLCPQVGEILISCNQNSERYGKDFQTVPDIEQDFSGPLAGMLAALSVSKTEWVLFVPCDVPAFPAGLSKSLSAGLSGQKAAYARDTEREHPTLCLLNRSLIPALTAYLENGDRKLMIFLHNIGAKSVLFSESLAFSNLNTPEDVALWKTRNQDLSR